MQSFVKNINGEFSVNGKPFRFIGANVYELANLETAVTNKIIDDAVETGFKALRFWLFQNKDVELQVKKLNEICDRVKPHGIKLIISLSDKWGYMQNYKIDDDWYKEGYKNEYLPYAKTLTKECSGRDEIMIWELINEPETGSFTPFYEFVKHAAGEIRTGNADHLLSVGTVGGVGDKLGNYFSVFKKSNFRNLYNIPELDAVSIHDYSYDSSVFERLDILYRFKGKEKKGRLYGKIDNVLDIFFDRADNWYLGRGKLIRVPFTLRGVWNRYNKSDIKFASSVNKPLYIGEVGFKGGMKRDRTKILELDIAEKFTLGVSGYMLWSFEAQGWSRDGHSYGFGINDGYGEIVKKWNRKLNAEN